MKSLAMLLVLLPLAVSAATITVNTTADNTAVRDGLCTLREAIANVNAAADTTGGDCLAGSGAGDTIKFGIGMPAKIRLRLGELLIQRDVSIENPAPGSLHIDGFGRSRVFEIAAGATSISNMAIERGKADKGGGVLVDNGASLTIANAVVAGNTAYAGDTGDSYGGALYNDGGTVALIDTALVRNTAKAGMSNYALGGGIYTNGGSLNLARCTVLGNKATATQPPHAGGIVTFGGGIFNLEGTVTATDSVLRANIAGGKFAYESGGGGISTGGGSVSLTACTLTRNASISGDHGQAHTSGGGIDNVDGTLNADGCTFERNRAVGPSRTSFARVDGGGIYNGGSGTVNLKDSTLVRNVATSGTNSFVAGGGISTEWGTIATLRGCTLSENVAVGHGGAGSSGGGVQNGGVMSLVNCTLIRNQAVEAHPSDFGVAAGGGVANGGDLTLTNCTLNGNRAARFPGWGGGIWGDATLANTIIADSGAGGDCDDESIITSAGHNMDSDGTCFTGGTDRPNVDPRLAPLRDYGGPTQTAALCTGRGVPDASCRGASPAIDTGDDSVTGPPDNLATDQRGLPRLSGAHVDIGAYEVQ